VQDKLEIAKFGIVGFSMGSLIAIRIALLMSSAQSSSSDASTTKTIATDKGRKTLSFLILLSSTGTSPTEAVQKAFYQVRDIWISTPQPSEEIMNASILNWGGSPDVSSHRAKQIKKYWIEQHFGAERINAILESINQRDDILGKLSELKGVPVLLIHGEDDQTWPLAEAEAIQRSLTGKGTTARLIIIPGAGHLLIHMRESADVTALVRGFVVENF
jgi:pimeloyl-ACP methyl ester carboxylesterase